MVVFDPTTYRDQATFEKPQEYATGVRYVFVAGQAAVDDGKPSPKLFGRALRHGSTAQSDGSSGDGTEEAAGNAAPFDVHVEVEEIACELPAYQLTNNGSGMFWSSGSTQMVRVGERLFVSAFEAVPGAAPLNNARWALYERRPEGWTLCQRDEKDRTREPCSLATSYSGRLLMSVNPTLAPLVHAPAKAVGGPARPEFLEFDSAHPQQKPQHLVPTWSENPTFTEHSYRAFSADGKNGEFILFNKIGTSQTAWAFLDQDGAWKTGLLTWPKGEDPKYSVWRGERTPVNYADVILSDRQVHYIGQSPINIWNRIDPANRETWGRDKWGWRMRKLHYAWTPDIKTKPFSEWILVDDTMDEGGTVGMGDSWLAPDGRLHLVWQREPINGKLRDLHFPDIKRDWQVCYGILEQGKLISKRVVASGGETTGAAASHGHHRPSTIAHHTELHDVHPLQHGGHHARNQVADRDLCRAHRAGRFRLGAGADPADASDHEHVLHGHAPCRESTHRGGRSADRRYDGRQTGGALRTHPVLPCRFFHEPMRRRGNGLRRQTRSDFHSGARTAHRFLAPFTSPQSW